MNFGTPAYMRPVYGVPADGKPSALETVLVLASGAAAIAITATAGLALYTLVTRELRRRR